MLACPSTPQPDVGDYTMKRWLLFALLLAACFQIADSAPPRIAFLKPYPRIVNDRNGLEVKVRVEPYPENRLLIIAALDASGEVVRRSDEQLDGESAPRTRWVRWRSGLPAGDLLVIAEVWDRQKPLARVSIPLCVIATFGEMCPSLSGPEP